MSTRRWWSSIQVSEPRAADNIVPIPARRVGLDVLAARVRELEQSLMDKAMQIDRLGLAFNSQRDELLQARAAMLEALKHEGVRADYPVAIPEAPYVGAADDDHP